MKRLLRRVACALLAMHGLAAGAADPAPRPARVGVVLPSVPRSEIDDPARPSTRKLEAVLAERGWVRGRNLILDLRTDEGDRSRIAGIVADLVRLKTDVILVAHAEIARIAAQATQTVPIVSFAGDPIAHGLGKNYNRPGGNVTGVMHAGLQRASVEQKRLELLHSMLPGIRRVAFVARRAWWEQWMEKPMREAAAPLGIQVMHIESRPDSFDQALAVARRDKPDAVFFEPSPEAIAMRDTIGRFARTSGIPTACGNSELVETGCLMTYNFSSDEMRRLVADQVDRILRGESPGNLPVLQYSKYEFLVNLKTARGLALRIPEAILLRADRVVE